jgi:predicted secreted protein
MHWFTAFVLYVMIWWTVLFAVLPVGTRPIAEADTTTGWRGAPAKPMMARKLIATTLVSALLWGGAMLVIQSGWISFRSGWLALPDN